MSTLLVNNITPVSGSTILTLKEAVSSAGLTVNVSGAVNINGNTALGNASGDSVTCNASTVAIPNNLNFDSNTLVLDASNNRVGIGTASPGSLLELYAEHPRLTLRSNNVNGDGQVHFRSADNSTMANIRCDVTNNTLNHFVISAGSAENQLVIDANGYVGIGTTSPNASLHVTGSAEIDGNLQVDGTLTVNGTTTTINSTTITVDDKNIELASTSSPSDSSADGGGITLKGDSDYTIAWSNSTDRWHYNQGVELDAGNLIVDAGNLGIGNTSPDCSLDIAKTSGGGHPFVKMRNHVADSEGSTVALMKSRNTTVGSHTIVQSGDELGNITFYGSDGDSFEQFAKIRGKVDGTPGASDCPGRLEFLTTADGANSPTIRMTIKNDGKVEFSGDLSIGDDLTLGSDGAILNFGADSDISLTHTADTSLSLGGAGGTTGLLINNTATDGDPFLSFALSGTQTFTMGVDDGDSDKFKIGTTAVGTNTRMTIDSTGKVGVGTTSPGSQFEVQDSTTSSANAGGAIRLSANDGAAMGDSHRLGVIEFTGAEDSSNTQVVGARIEALTDAAWTNAENGCALYFYTTDGNASQSQVLKMDSNKKATFGGVLALPDGSAAAPSLTNDGDTNCGLYFSAADTLAFTAGGTAQVTFSDGVIAPVTTDDVSLGTASLRFANVFTMDLHLANDRGDWTVIEEEDYLSLRNNKNGKMFKIVMEEIE